MRTFYFNTGVRPYNHNPPIKISKGEVLRGGTKQIPFDCNDVPENAVFMFACDNPDLKVLKYGDFIVREIFNSVLCSKYAYFRIFN